MSKTKTTKKPAVRKTAAGKKSSVSPKRKNVAKSKRKEKSSSKEEFPHFRKHNASNHPALITGEHSEKEYDYRKVTHSEKDGRHRNEKVSPNPNPKDPRPMYIGKRVRHDEKKNFGKKYPWKYPSKQKNKK